MVVATCDTVGLVEATDPEAGARAVLREPAERVSRRAMLMWTVEALVGATVLLAGQVVWWFVDSSSSRTAHWVVGAVWLAAAAAYAVVMPRWRYRVHRWESTARAVYTQTGWLWQERRIAPLSRVQTVDLERGRSPSCSGSRRSPSPRRRQPARCASTASTCRSRRPSCRP